MLLELSIIGAQGHLYRDETIYLLHVISLVKGESIFVVARCSFHPCTFCTYHRRFESQTMHDLHLRI